MPETMLEVTTADGQADAFVAYPDGDGRFPAVLMYPDIFGLRPALNDMATEIAQRGYYVLVPNVFYRAGAAPVVELPDHIGADQRGDVIGELMPLMKAHTVDRVLSDAGYYLDFLTQQPQVADGPVAVTGYCMGAVLALRTAAAHPDRVNVLAGFHPPNLVTDAPDSPHRLASDLSARVHIGVADGDMTPEQVDQLRSAFDAAGIDNTCEIYAGAAHGFTMADTDAFDSAASQRHWDRLFALLEH